MQCDECDAVSNTLTVSIGEALGHSFTTKASSQMATPATCQSAATYYVQCDRCDAVNEDMTVSVGMPSYIHTYTTKASGRWAANATCTDAAVYYKSCKCGEKGTETFTSGEALGHKWGAWTSISSTQHQRVCERDSSDVETAKHTFKRNTCEDCGYTRSGRIDPVTPVTPVKPTLPFKDVRRSDWSNDDIAYVYEKGLMNGTAATAFSSKMDTSRAMIVTILW